MPSFVVCIKNMISPMLFINKF